MAAPTYNQFKLRLPVRLREQLDAASAENERSLNAEIVARLEASFGSANETAAQLEALQVSVEKLQRTYDENAALFARMKAIEQHPDVQRILETERRVRENFGKPTK